MAGFPKHLKKQYVEITVYKVEVDDNCIEFSASRGSRSWCTREEIYERFGSPGIRKVDEHVEYVKRLADERLSKVSLIVTEDIHPVRPNEKSIKPLDYLC